jgi:hypothetical protein
MPKEFGAGDAASSMYKDAIDRSWTSLLMAQSGGIFRELAPAMSTWICLWYVCDHVSENHPENWHYYTAPVNNHKDKIQGLATFLLGFYLSSIYGRWYELYVCIPWPDGLAIYLHASLNGEEHKNLKKTLLRYMMIELALTFMWISPNFSKKYPNLGALVDINLLTDEERKHLNHLYVKDFNECTYWTPFLWFTNLHYASFRNGEIKSEMIMYQLQERARGFHAMCGDLWILSDVSIPLGYMQLTASIVWGTYFLTLLCNHVKDDNLPPLVSILTNWLLLGMLYISHDMLHPLGDGESASFPLLGYFERNLVICETILGCPLTQEMEEAWSKQKHEESKFDGVKIAKQPNLMADGDQGLHSYVPKS